MSTLVTNIGELVTNDPHADDHQEGVRAFKEKREIVDRIIEALSVHAVIEEQLFYPVTRETVPETHDVVLESGMVETSLMDAAGILKETLYEYEPTGNRRSYERGLEAMNAVNRSLEQELLRAWGRVPAARRQVA